jgi:hypothetical protein
MENNTALTFVEITPFLVGIISRLLGSGFREKFDQNMNCLELDGYQFGKQRSAIEDISYQSSHWSSCETHFEIALIAVVIIFFTKMVRVTDPDVLIPILGIFSFVCVYAMFIFSNRYFSNRSASKYWVKDCLTKEIRSRVFIIHYGDIFVVCANAIPIFSILILDLIS